MYYLLARMILEFGGTTRHHSITNYKAQNSYNIPCFIGLLIRPSQRFSSASLRLRVYPGTRYSFYLDPCDYTDEILNSLALNYST